MNNINDKTNKKCTGCQFCEAVCPKNAISIILDCDGFYKPVIDEEKCISCSICKQSCIKFNDCDLSDNPKTAFFSVINKEKYILNQSASGGFSYPLFKYLISQNYLILGVEYNISEKKAQYSICDSEIDLKKYFGSKYMQATAQNVFKTITRNHKKYAIIGTPCLIYSISNWAMKNKQMDRFVFIDFFCHGTPTLNLWKCYIKKYNDNLKKVEFRSKNYGWHEFAHTFLYCNKQKIISKKTHEDPFFEMYFDNQLLNESCYECDSRNCLNYSDIRIGDYWGYKFDNNTKGVSTVLINSKRGGDIFEKIKNQFVYNIEKKEDILSQQAFKVAYSYNLNIREKYLKKLLTNDSIDTIFKSYIKDMSLIKRVNRDLKIMFSYLPKKLQYKIKEYYHKKRS